MRNETAQMKTTITGSGTLECLLDDLVVVQFALLDGLINTNDVLPNDTTGSNIQVTDFGVAHKTIRQANCQGRGVQLGETLGIVRKLVHHGGLGRRNGVAILGRFFGGNTPSINDD